MRSSTSASVSPPAISSSNSTDGSPASARASSRRLRLRSVSLPACWLALSVSRGQFEGLDAPFVAGPLAQAAAIRRTHQHVLEDAHVGERLGDLERAPNAVTAPILPRQMRDVAALEDDSTVVGPIDAADQVEQGRLAGAVRPDDAQRFAVVQLHAQVVDDLHAAERLAQYVVSSTTSSVAHRRAPEVAVAGAGLGRDVISAPQACEGRRVCPSRGW